MFNSVRLVLAVFIGLCCTVPAVAQERPRLIVLTDIGTEPDDIESMVRLLTYANEIEIEGLIASTSRHLHDRVYPQLIEERVDAYGQVLANLRVHDPRYPDAALLKSRIKSGVPLLGMAAVGKGKDSAGSRHIIEVVDRADKRPVWISVWGGAATLSQALWTVRQTRSPKEVAKFIAKLRVYSISDQDDSGPWARATFPQLFWIASVHGPSRYQLATWTGISEAMPGADQEPVSKQWLRANIQSKGPLGALYPLPMFIMEGDTPSFLNLIDNGLAVPDRPDWGGWGGRWEKPSSDFGFWADTVDTVAGVDGKNHTNNKATIWRWRWAFQNDFAARMIWSVTPEFKGANHAPKLVVNGHGGSAPVTIVTCPGAPVSLSAKGTADPDGHALTYKWWRYNEANFLIQPTTLTDPNGVETGFTMPVWEQFHEMPLQPLARVHIVLEVSDAGTPKLTRYRRLFIDVATDGRSVNGKTCPKITYLKRPEGIGFATGAVPVSDAAYSTHITDVGTMIDDPRLLPILQRYVPQIIDAAKHTEQARTVTLRGVMNFIPGLTAATLDAMDAELAKIPAKP
jgi:hypothetical protein